MAIPAFNQFGLLPPGIHECTLSEVRSRFGTFQFPDRRPILFQKIHEFVAEAQTARFAIALLIDGSFVSAKPDPNDVDLVLVLPFEHDLVADLNPGQYNLVSRRRVQKRFGFDILSVREGTLEYDEAVAFFEQVRHQPGLRNIMIQDNEQLQQAIEQMGRMQRILESYRADMLPKNSRNFAAFAEGPLDEIRKLQVEIDQYVSRLEQVGAA